MPMYCYVTVGYFTRLCNSIELLALKSNTYCYITNLMIPFCVQ